MASGDQLDGIADDLATHERGLHALRAHGDAVRDRDGVELHRGSARFADPGLDGLGQLAVVVVAGHGCDPAVTNADDGLGEVLTAEADGAQVGARRRPVGARQHLLAATRGSICHQSRKNTGLSAEGNVALIGLRLICTWPTSSSVASTCRCRCRLSCWRRWRWLPLLSA